MLPKIQADTQSGDFPARFLSLAPQRGKGMGRVSYAEE